MPKSFLRASRASGSTKRRVLLLVDFLGWEPDGGCKRSPGMSRRRRRQQRYCQPQPAEVRGE